jgi:hypothetical protein
MNEEGYTYTLERSPKDASNNGESPIKEVISAQVCNPSDSTNVAAIWVLELMRRTIVNMRRKTQPEPLAKPWRMVTTMQAIRQAE